MTVLLSRVDECRRRVDNEAKCIFGGNRLLARLSRNRFHRCLVLVNRFTPRIAYIKAALWRLFYSQPPLSVEFSHEVLRQPVRARNLIAREHHVRLHAYEKA